MVGDTHAVPIGPTEFDLWIPGPPLPVLQADTMTKWARITYRRAWHTKVRWALRAAGRKPGEPLFEEIAIEYTRASTGKKPDYVNLVYSAKALIDALIEKDRFGLIKDDADSFVPIQSFHYERVRLEKKVGVRLRIWRIQ